MRTIPLTRSFKDLVQKRVASDVAFGAAMLREGIDTMLTGDVDTGKAILHDYIKVTIGLEKLIRMSMAAAQQITTSSRDRRHGRSGPARA
jgi:hypothetical protein